MDENMNNGQNTDANQQMYQQNGQQMYGQTDMNQQMYQQNGQQMYGGQPYGQTGMNQQMYQQNGQQMYGGQPYGQTDMNQQMYQQNGQQMYGGQPYGQTGMNQQMYTNQQTPSGKSSKFDLDKIKDTINNNKNLVIMCGAALVALILIIVLARGFLGHGKQSPKGVAKAYTKAYAKDKPKDIYKLYDKKFIKETMKEYDYGKDDIMDEIEDEIDDFYDDLEYYEIGKVKKIKCDIEEVEKAKGKDLKDMKEYFDEYADLKISGLASVEMEWEIKGKDDDIDYKAYVYTYKRMGKWYLYNASQYKD